MERRGRQRGDKVEKMGRQGETRGRQGKRQGGDKGERKVTEGREE